MTSHLLQSDELDVRIAKPGTYHGSRFDWTGFITQVTWRKAGLAFCTVESDIPGGGSGGIGLCNEFGIVQPIGYEEAAPGGWFSKPGVGLLQRPDGDSYSFFRPYRIRPFDIRTEAAQDRVSVQVLPMEANGYAFRLDKTISLDGARLRVAYRLVNVGTKTIETEEYVHNFLRIGCHSLGPDYALTFGGPVTLLETNPELTSDFELDGNVIHWLRKPEGVFYSKLPAPEREHPFTWELRHVPSGAYMRESGDFPVARMALWGRASVVSPEVFIDIRLEPGEELGWTRTFEFFAE